MKKKTDGAKITLEPTSWTMDVVSVTGPRKVILLTRKEMLWYHSYKSLYQNSILR